MKPKRKLIAADLFCGAGGTSAGLMDACDDLGLSVELTAINHWEVAVATHTKNHPGARHLCASLDALNPRDLYQEGELKVLWASPECTHHSVARGGKPIRDQSRATAWCVVRWAEALRPDILLIENVKEFRGWGPLIRKRVFDKKKKRMVLDWVPDPKRKGEIFLSWLRNLEAIGYTVDHRILCAADYGDPTTRQRLFIQCVRKGSRYKLCWPNPTHAETPVRDLLGPKLQPWVPARAIIDWSLKGESIFTRKKSLADNTLRRIAIGLERFGLKDFIVPQQRFDNQSADSVDKPLRTITSTGGRLFNLISPAVIKMRGTNNAADVNKPMPAVTAGGNHLGVMQPCLVQTDQTGSNGDCIRSTQQPLPTVVTRKNIGVMEPCLVEVNHGKNSKTENHRVKSVNKPMGVVTGSRGHGLCEFTLNCSHGSSNGAVRSADKPLHTVTTAKGGELAVVEPYIVPANYGERKGQQPRAHSVDKPMPSVVGSPTHGVVEPKLTPFMCSAGGPKRDARSTDQPVPTITCKDSLAVVEPQIVKFYGSGISKPVSQTLDAVTTKERFGLAEPVLEQINAAVRAGRKPLLEINGQVYVLDILFRMLNWRELAQAQGFRPDYQFTGKTEAVVKQIGNAVPRRLARAIVKAVLSQNPNV